ncbi:MULTISPECIES: hypothetical protein [Pseudomonas]|uniref:3-isopropylmalate dehydratase n=1 Tax=Pseudomonas saxonica TaxID=2600598 RepID=A0A5C5PSM0_9PSED|nr:MULTISPECIES: hypothetical protein [Pseudomonas]MCH4873623.1 hypothetical protein [Pseudomonas sp. TMW22091]TWR85170.1 hypothetical protein FJD37_19235 [Pseudomonas saxonica]TWR90880.1 hypothetical protein FJD38_07335 [Pseudomonas saxonica]WRQ76406.1 hypothetical protein VQY67_07305 [Pseudomonas saxonica]
MRWSTLSLVSLLGLASLPLWANAAQDYGVLIISRERLEVPTNCEIGIYIDDQLAGRLFQEQSLSFNLPAGNVGIRLKLLPGQAPGCLPGMLVPPAQQFTLKAGDVVKYRMALGKDGVYLKPAALGY